MQIFFLSSFSQLYALFFFYFLAILSITSPKKTKHKEPLSQQPSASPLGRFSLPHDPIIGSWSLGTKGRGSGSCLKLPHINIEYFMCYVHCPGALDNPYKLLVNYWVYPGTTGRAKIIFLSNFNSKCILKSTLDLLLM